MDYARVSLSIYYMSICRTIYRILYRFTHQMESEIYDYIINSHTWLDQNSTIRVNCKVTKLKKSCHILNKVNVIIFSS